MAHDEGRIDGAGLRAVEERAIAAMLDLQRQVGVDVYSDGEYRRGMWYGPPATMEGLVRRPAPASAPAGARCPARAARRACADARGRPNPPAIMVGALSPARRPTGTSRRSSSAHAAGAVEDHDAGPTWYLRADQGLSDAGRTRPVLQGPPGAPID